jgi:hypothetical protein
VRPRSKRRLGGASRGRRRTRAALVVAAGGCALVACVSTAFPDARYACDPQGGSDECPPGLTCGSDGLCRYLGIAGDAAAFDASDDGSDGGASDGGPVGHLVVYGGRNGSLPEGGVASTSVIVAPIYADGSLGEWTTSSLPAGQGASSEAWAMGGGFAYMLGGVDDSDAALGRVLVAPLSGPGGGPGTWTSTAVLPAVRFHGAAAYSDGYLYFAGGFDPSLDAAVDTYGAQVQPDGGLTQWASATPLPSALGSQSFAAQGQWLYVTGGSQVSTFGGAGTATVLSASAMSDGGLSNWSSQAQFSGVRFLHASVVQGGRLYVLGGFGADLGVVLSDTQVATVSGGTVSGWQAAQSLPHPLAMHCAVAFGDYVYVAGGLRQLDADAEQDVLFARIQADGTLAAWSPARPLPDARLTPACIAY